MSGPALSFDQLENDMGIPCNGYRRCTRQAMYIVHIHCVDDCKKPDQLDIHGDIIFFMCPACMSAAGWRVGEIIGEMYSDIPDNMADDTELMCGTCERRIMEIHDIFSAERLRDGRMHQM